MITEHNNALLIIDIESGRGSLEIGFSYEDGAGGDNMPGTRVRIDHPVFCQIEGGRVTADINSFLEALFTNPELFRLLAEAYGDDYMSVELVEGEDYLPEILHFAGLNDQGGEDDDMEFDDDAHPFTGEEYAGMFDDEDMDAGDEELFDPDEADLV